MLGTHPEVRMPLPLFGLRAVEGNELITNNWYYWYYKGRGRK